jgi:Fe-S-cluster containining protein
VARFVLWADPDHQALMVMADPGMPLAWKREPYYARLKQLSESSFRQDKKILVNLKGNITVLLPDREVPLGKIDPGAKIIVWREGSAYGATLRQDRKPTKELPPKLADTKGKPATGPSAVDDPGFLESVFKEAFAKTCKLLDDPKIDDVEALTWSIRGRNKVLDETAGTYAEAAGAECRAGCVSCCYLTVSGPPFEIFSIARHLLDTKTRAELEGLRKRLQQVSEIPVDPTLRVRARIPCALLEDGRCSIYEQRPSVCRMALSQSRAACDACLKGAGGFIPYIEQPSKLAVAMQMGIDHALITRRNLSTEGSELSRALLIALDDYESAFRSWLQGKDPFPGAHVGAPGAPSSRDRTSAAAKRLGIA